jgi:hypothetical protein
VPGSVAGLPGVGLGGGAGAGRTLRGARLVVLDTQRTVEMHLSNAFRKLEIKSRTQLPAALAS